MLRGLRRQAMNTDRDNLVRGAAPFGTTGMTGAPAAGGPTAAVGGSGFRSSSPATLPVSGDIEAQQQPEPTLLQQSSNPTALIFHLLFRCSAILVYLLGWLIVSNFVLNFVLIILLLAFDFWTVKNVTGRLLVGLRWWNEVKDDGSSEWVFETREGRQVNAVDSRVFWYSLYGAPIAWVLFAVLAIFRLQASWFVVSIVGVSMSMANLVGYVQCERDAKKKAGSNNSGLFGGESLVGGLIGRAMMRS